MSYHHPRREKLGLALVCLTTPTMPVAVLCAPEEWTHSLFVTWIALLALELWCVCPPARGGTRADDSDAQS